MAASAQIDFRNRSTPAARFEPEFELQLACCGFGNESAVAEFIGPSLNWESVIESAEHHRLIPALNATLAKAGVAPKILREHARVHAWRALRLTAELARIARCFEQYKIQFLAHKGPLLAQVLYGDPTSRQYGDLDLLVRPRDVASARDALSTLGYRPVLRLSASQEQSYLRSGYELVFGTDADPHLVELQWQIVPRFYSIQFDMDALFSRSTTVELDGTRLRTLAHEDLLLVLCVHAAKHQWSQVGMLRDIATLAGLDLNWTWTYCEARRLGILRIVHLSLAAALELFQMNLSGFAEPAIEAPTKKSLFALTDELRKNSEPDVESITYFRKQIQTRERWRDRCRVIWRLATTPSVGEWQAIRIPDRFFGLYHCVRVCRLVNNLARRAVSKNSS